MATLRLLTLAIFIAVDFDVHAIVVGRRQVLLGMAAIGGMVESKPSHARNLEESSSLVELRKFAIGELYGWPASGFLDRGHGRAAFDYAYYLMRANYTFDHQFTTAVEIASAEIRHRLLALLTSNEKIQPSEMIYPDFVDAKLPPLNRPTEERRVHASLAAMEVELARKYPQYDLNEVYLAINFILSPRRLVESAFDRAPGTWADHTPLMDAFVTDYINKISEVSPGLALRIAESYDDFIKPKSQTPLFDILISEHISMPNGTADFYTKRLSIRDAAAKIIRMPTSKLRNALIKSLSQIEKSNNCVKAITSSNKSS